MECTCNRDGLRDAVVIAVQRDDGRWLQIVRSATVPAPGRVGFVGGRTEAGETIRQAAAREIREELGAEVEVGRVLGCGAFPQWNAHTIIVGARMDAGQPLTPDANEVAAVLWLTRGELTSHPDRLESNDAFAPLLPA